MSRPVKPRIRVGDALIEEGAITPKQLEKALAEQKTTGLMLGELLVAQGVINSTVLTRTLAKCLGVKGVLLRHGLIDGALLKLRFRLPGGEELHELEARVKWSRSAAKGAPAHAPGMGIQFTDCAATATLARELDRLE